jgi:hypothetical protein
MEIPLGIGGLVIVLGVLEFAVGGLEFSASQVLSLGNIGVGVGLIALGVSMIYPLLQRATDEVYLSDLSAWLESLLTNRESPLASRVEVTSLANKIFGASEGSIVSRQNRILEEIEDLDQKMRLSFAELREHNERIFKRENDVSLSTELKTLKQELERARALLSDPESPLLSRFEDTQAEVQRLRKNELGHLRKGLTQVSKQVKKIEQWNR